MMATVEKPPIDPATAWIVIGALVTTILGLVGVIKMLWDKLGAAQAEIVRLTGQHVVELEEIKKLIEAKRGGGP